MGDKKKAKAEVVEEAVEDALDTNVKSEPVEEDVPPLAGDAADVNASLIALEEEKESYRDALIRERADFENYRKRNAELSAVSFGNGVADAVAAILPVLDNFERALATECADQAFVDGMAMIMRQLSDVLMTLGVEEIDTKGQFNPVVHNAVMQVEDEGFGSNDVVETLQKGYKLKDKILRHAMVKVNK